MSLLPGCLATVLFAYFLYGGITAGLVAIIAAVVLWSGPGEAN